MSEQPEAYEIANDAELACGTSGGCRRDGCNGFLCRDAIDAAVKAERERCAQIAEREADDYWDKANLVSAIRSGKP